MVPRGYIIFVDAFPFACDGVDDLCVPFLVAFLPSGKCCSSGCLPEGGVAEGRRKKYGRRNNER